MEKKEKYFGIFLALVILVIGFVFGKLESVKSTVATQKNESENSQRVVGGELYNFINPLLDCGEVSNVSNSGIDKMKSGVEHFIDQEKTKGVDQVAVYFRDLNNGPWFGIKEKDSFLPASLLKVPLMMNVFRQAMGDPSFLNKQFVWQGGDMNNEYFKAPSELQDNHTYSIGEAVDYMIRYSDNNAVSVLGYAIDTSTLLSSYTELGIAPPNNSDYSISARKYASFFRILYNSTFLNKEYSERALRLLSETAFNKGLVAGVPKNIKVAHKFGERNVDNTTKQLHDCGIVYFPKKPYLLCVMTRGKDFDKLTSFISQVSKIVYEGVEGGQVDKK